jgi:hypothetical protein
MKEKAEKADIEKYISNQNAASSNLGELIQEEIERRGRVPLPKKEDE